MIRTGSGAADQQRRQTAYRIEHIWKEKEMMKTRSCKKRLLSVLILFILTLSAVLPAGCRSAGSTENSADHFSPDSSGTRAAAEEAAVPGQVPASGEVEEGLFRAGLVEDMDTMDVHRTTSEYVVAINVFERLFEIRQNDDETTELVPGLAEDYSLSEDGRVYTFTLRDDAFFSDGTPVRASDVAFTFSRMLSLPDSMQTDFADMILGADAVMAHKTDTPEGIRVLDDRHVEITLTEPFAGYIYQVATPSCSILSEKCVLDAGDDYGTSPETTIGSGPYMVTEYRSGKGMTLELNPYWKKGKPSVRKARFLVLDPALMDAAFRKGELDLLDLDAIHTDTIKSVYKSDKWKDHLVSKGCVETNYMMMNLDTRPLNNTRVRKAVQMAINRQKIVDELYDGEGTLVDGIFPRGLHGYSEENQGWLKYDPEGARRYLKRAGKDIKTRIELAADSTASMRELNLLNMIRQDLQAVGLQVSIVSYDPESWMYLRTHGKLMAFCSVWSADYNDPDNFIYTFFGSREKTLRRSGNFAEQNVMDRIGRARTIQDDDARMSEYAALETLLIRDKALWVPLFSTNHLFVLGDRVESFVPYWAGWNSIPLKDVVLK